jgi:hypothetical protein
LLHLLAAAFGTWSTSWDVRDQGESWGINGLAKPALLEFKIFSTLPIVSDDGRSTRQIAQKAAIGLKLQWRSLLDHGWRPFVMLLLLSVFMATLVGTCLDYYQISEQRLSFVISLLLQSLFVFVHWRPACHSAKIICGSTCSRSKLSEEIDTPMRRTPLRSGN